MEDGVVRYREIRNLDHCPYDEGLTARSLSLSFETQLSDVTREDL